MTADELLDQLKDLLPAQFEEVVRKAGIPPAYLSGDNQVTRAISLIRYAEQKRLVEKLRRLVVPLGDDASTGLRFEVKEALEEYRKCRQGAFEAWELRNAGPAPTTGHQLTEVTLDEMYIPLRFAAMPDPAKVDRSAFITPDDLLRPRPRQVIVGPAGSGKTTWMRWTFRSLIRDRRALPFFLELRAIAAAWSDLAHAERPIEHYLAAALADCGVSDAAMVVDEIIANPSGLHIVLLVDGWDELDVHGDFLRKRLIDFTGSFSPVVVVVSSRPFGASSPNRLESFETQYIQPLSDDDVRLLTQRFHRRAHGLDKAGEQRATEEFMTAIDAAREARSLAGTALLLTMMLLLSRQAQLPDKRHRLYDACLRTMLMHRVTRRTGTIDGEQWCPSDGMTSLRVVAALAYRMQTEDYEISGRAPLIRPWKTAEDLLPAKWTKDQRSGFLRWLIASAGVLMDRTDNSVHFAHLSFQEHLTAYHLHVSFEDKARVEMMQNLMSNRSWWATLRLWAGLTGDEKPEKLTPVFDMLRVQHNGFWLAGQIFADGTGEESDFETWCAELAPRLCTPSDTSDECALAWGACKQSERHAILAHKLRSVRGGLHWLDASRHAHWCRLANLDVDPGAALRMVSPPIDSAHAVARSRVLFGGAASWPDGGELAVLRLWPSVRAGIGVRLQSAISLGAGVADVMSVLPALLARAKRSWSTRSDLSAQLSGEPVAPHDGSLEKDESRKSEQHSLVEDFVRRLIEGTDGALIRKYISEFDRPFVRDFIREVVRYVSGHFVRELDRNVVQYIAREYGRTFVRKVVREFGAQFERDFVSDFVSHFVMRVVRDYRQDFAIDFAYHFNEGFVRDFGQYFGPIFSRELSPEFGPRATTGVASWLPAFAFLEASSVVGRAASRLALAYGYFQKDQQQLLELFNRACRRSFGRADYPRDQVNSVCDTFVGDRMWPALARQIARMSTTEDRILLEDLAAHPEKREGLLSWGLQYYVRGDLVFDDGSVTSLDELCHRCNVTPPRLLEDMPAELDIPLSYAWRSERSVDNARDNHPHDPPSEPSTPTEDAVPPDAPQ